jgi:translation initiation factor 2 beta subunit (eIF-2beta)/eIF-5
MINYYTKRLGLDGHISKEKLLLQEDKTRIEMELELQKKELDDLREMFARFQSER